MTPLSLAALIAQLATLELLQAMYPSESSLTPESTLLVQTAQDRITRLEKGKGRALYDGKGEEGMGGAGGGIELCIELRIGTGDDGNGEGTDEMTVVVIIITISLVRPRQESNSTNLDEEQPISQIRTNQPTWLSRSAHLALQQSIYHRSLDPLLPPEEKEAYSLIQFAQTSLEGLFATYCEETRIAEAEKKDRMEGVAKGGEREGEGEGEVRVWFWFPSLSTREKRDDMVNWAPMYGLSGWVLAGTSLTLLSLLSQLPRSISRRIGNHLDRMLAVWRRRRCSLTVRT